MNEATRLEIFKTKELADLFNEMSEEVKLRVVRNAFTKAAKVINTQVAANLDGSVKHSFKFTKQLGYKMTRGQWEMTVGMKKGTRYSRQVAHLIERGTVARYYTVQKRNPRYPAKIGSKHFTGSMSAKHFFESAINTTEGQVNEEIYTYIRDAFTRLVNKYERKK